MGGPGGPRSAWTVVLLLGVLAACSDSSTSTSPTASDLVPSTTEAAPPATPEPRGDDRPATTTFALENVRLIDGLGGPPINDAVVVVLDGRIGAAGSAETVEIPVDVPTYGLGGATVTPGWFNAHVHDVFDPEVLRAFAADGVTTVCDLNFRPDLPPRDIFELRDEVDVADGARLVAAGKIINVEGAYPIVFFDGLPVTFAPGDTDAAVAAVDEMIDAGARIIKTAFETGGYFNQEGWPVMSVETGQAMVAAAHERGVPVIAHTMTATDLETAVMAGVDGIAHGIFGDLSDELVSEMAANGTFVITTSELFFHADSLTGYPSLPIVLTNLATLADAGVPLVIGTDYAGIDNVDAPFDLGMPVREIAQLTEAGLEPMDIIEAGTRNAAEACNVIDETGTIESGKAADLLVLDGDPLEDLGVLETPTMVFREGRLLGD